MQSVITHHQSAHPLQVMRDQPSLDLVDSYDNYFSEQKDKYLHVVKVGPGAKMQISTLFLECFIQIFLQEQEKIENSSYYRR